LEKRKRRRRARVREGEAEEKRVLRERESKGIRESVPE
jgi:hypothetical protein